MSPAARSASPPAVPTAWMRLYRLGPLTWPALRALLTEDSRYAGARCAWSDLHGFHLEPATALPVRPPVTTHLWSWAADTALRARLDDGRALTAVLRPEPGGIGPGSDLGSAGTGTGNGPDEVAEPVRVRVRIRPGLPWQPDDRQVGRPDRPLPAPRLQLLELTGSTPATFVREHSEQPALPHGATR